MILPKSSVNLALNSCMISTEGFLLVITALILLMDLTAFSDPLFQVCNIRLSILLPFIALILLFQFLLVLLFPICELLILMWVIEVKQAFEVKQA